MFPILAIALTIIISIIVLSRDSSGFSNKEVKEMNEMINKGLTPTDRFSNVIRYQVNQGIQEIRKQVSTDVDKARKMIESS